MRFLESRNIDIVAGPADGVAATEAVWASEEDVVLLVPSDFGEELAEMIPATVELYFDQANTTGIAKISRVRDALFGYNQTVAGIRLSPGVSTRRCCGRSHRSYRRFDTQRTRRDSAWHFELSIPFRPAHGRHVSSN